MNRTSIFVLVSSERTFPTLSIESDPFVSENPEYGSSSGRHCLDACFTSGLTLSLVVAREHKRQWLLDYYPCVQPALQDREISGNAWTCHVKECNLQVQNQGLQVKNPT